MDQDQAAATIFSLNLYAHIGADGGGCPIAGTAGLFGNRDQTVPLGVANTNEHDRNSGQRSLFKARAAEGRGGNTDRSRQLKENYHA